MTSKRGQITIFILIGILILVAAAAYLYYQRASVGLPEVEKIPAAFLPVREYVEGCIRSTAEQGADIMGLQGGYIAVPPHISANPYSYLPLTQDRGLKVPYWYYEGVSRIPSLENMGTDLAAYVDENVQYCLGGLEPLKELFDIEVQSAPSSAAVIASDAVAVVTKMPIKARVKGSGEETTILSYSSSLPVSLKRMHDLGVEVMTRENQEMYMEKLTVNLMAIGPDIPFTGMELQCSKLKWSKQQVQDDIKNLLFYNVPRVTLEKTKHPPIPADDDLGRHMFSWQATSSDFRDITAGVVFSKDWPFQMVVRPSSGNVMSASFGQGAEKYLQYLCINTYHFTYDLIYPVQIVLEDPDAFNGRGYLFTFAFPVLVNHNKGDRTNFPIATFESPEQDLEACSDRDAAPFTIRATNPDGEYVKDANVTFNCANMIYCHLGTTEFTGGIYSLMTQLPSFCDPGMLRLDHPDYLSATVAIDRDRRAADVDLTPLKKLSFSVQKKQIRVNALDVRTYPLDEGEYAVLFITSKDIPEFEAVRRYPLDPESAAELDEKARREMTKLQLVVKEGVTYDIDLVLFNKDDELIGGYRGNWMPSAANFIGRSKVVFTAMEQLPHPSDAIQDQYKTFTNIQNPEFTRHIQPLFED
ncbi:hypothetical protein HYU19_05265 [Candidatus Woesearchaeota archaeon]|nr:hypothetical protein [Candidatus Woesearchaeota archaeon]